MRKALTMLSGHNTRMCAMIQICGELITSRDVTKTSMSDEEQIPALKPVLQAARQGAARFLHQKEISLSVGFWINDMGPGHVTVPHTHDEDDELVSAVYYVRVPENSGDLVLTRGVASTRITARQGMFVFFAPDVMHEVTENKSGGTRLSIGMNFGIKSS